MPQSYLDSVIFPSSKMKLVSLIYAINEQNAKINFTLVLYIVRLEVVMKMRRRP